MKRLLISSAFLFVALLNAKLLAQQPMPTLVEQPTPATETVAAASELPELDSGAQTESMWFYLQELRRYDDPRTVIRRKAEKKAEQRRTRLAAQKWYGYSGGRPLASHTPFMGTYSSMWVGNGKDAFQWVGSGYVTTAVKVELSDQKRR